MHWPWLFLIAAILLPASEARADCSAEFARLNTVKLSAGPFRVKRHVVATINEAGSERTMHEATKQVEIAPPSSLHVFEEEDGHKKEWIILAGVEGWEFEGGKWSTLDGDALTSLLDWASVAEYFNSKGMFQLECQDAEIFESRPVLAFRYNLGSAGDALHRKVYFDAKTGLPVAGVDVLEGLQPHIRADEAFSFDQTIKIGRP